MPAAKSMQKAALTALENWLAHRTRFGDIPGLQVCIRQNGAVIFSRAFGYASQTTQEKYTTAHAGHLASQSKMFTGCLALMLMEQGALSISDTAATHLPWLNRHKDSRAKDITLRDLLTHRAGIFRDGLDAAFWELEKPFPTREQLQADILAAKLVYDPNTETKYSNAGMSLLGLALESATGMEYADLAQKYILSKLPRAQLSPDCGLRPGMKYAQGHTKRVFDEQRKQLRDEPANALAPAAGFCGTAEAASAFLHAYLNTDTFIPARLRREVMHLNWKVRNLTSESYGLGMSFSGVDDDIYIGHSGGYPGFASQTRHLKGSDYTFSAVANINDVDTMAILRTMADLIRKAETLFADDKKIDVSPVVMNKWGSWQYLVGSKIALSIMSDMPTPIEGAQTLERGRDGAWYNEKANGYTNVGEPITFIRKGGKIAAVKSGSNMLYPADEFLKRAKKTLA
jgi:CubicO group peptidase (beta-lactamase class C family)